MENLADLFKIVEDGYAINKGVRIHFVSMGSGPLVIMIHGFPEFWYSWRHQMTALAKLFRVVAVDLRGYNLSDSPKGVEAYKTRHLVGDVAAVVKHLGASKATIVGHDWGGMVSWACAMFHPEMVEQLIICNLPHPACLARELAHNPDQQRNSQYARDFQKEGYHEKLSAEDLSAWIRDEDAKKHYLESYRRSSFEAMLNYYKANYPSEPYEYTEATMPKIQCPVLMIHGLDDQALLPGALNNTWAWVEKDLTLVAVPGAGHFVHQEVPDLVTRSMLMWLNR